MADYYREQYGERTDELFAQLSKPAAKIALINPWLTSLQLKDILVQAVPEIILGHTFYQVPTDCAPRMIDGLMSHYFLDRSSVLAPLMLPLEPGMQVLDMCSAPGGKLLVMLARMIRGVTFVANDVSPQRALRLKKVITDFVPQAHRLAHVSLTIKDAHYFGLKQAGGFDAVLLDAPCSSEGHVIHQEHLMKIFKGPQKGLPMRQYSLLAAALLALKPGRYAMYATCTINKPENEGVIQKLVTKKGKLYSLVRLAAPLGEVGPYGVTILPHLHGAGPAFLSLIKT